MKRSAAVLCCLLASTVSAADWKVKVEPRLLALGAGEKAEFLVVLAEQADVSRAERMKTKAAKGRYVFEQLSRTAERSQASLLAELSALGVEHRPYWIVNMIWVNGGRDAVQAMARRAEVDRISANPTVRMQYPRVSEAPDRAPNAIEWGVAKIGAPDFWAIGKTGQGVVVAGADTGYDWTHAALKGKYRGWNGSAADHNYSWHDSIHSGGGSCGANSAQPCDDDLHGTHTMGTMVGDDGAGNQIGVAPGAKWMGCRNMDQGNGTPTTYAECFQFFIAPTNLAGQNPDPSKSPDVINNSWGCPVSEGCTDPNVLKTVVDNTRAAGIVVVVSAGNSGSLCSTVNTPAAIYDSAFSVGASQDTAADTIASFSSRGPVTLDGSNRLKPDVVAPGVGVRSSIPGGGYTNLQGTSMAGPHVAGLVALTQSAAPWLNGQVSRIESHLTRFAVPRFSATQDCGSDPRFFGAQRPNHTYGYGRVRTVMPHATPIDLDGNGVSNVVLWKDGAWRTFTAPSAPEPTR
jgi:subtilisin family serine protease